MRNDSRMLLVAAAMAGLLGAVPVSVAAPEQVPTAPAPPPSTPRPAWPVATPTDFRLPTTEGHDPQTTTTTSAQPEPTTTTTQPEPTTTTTKPEPTTTTGQPLTTTPRPTTAGTSIVPSGSSAVLPAPTLVAPATAERGTVITVHGEGWPCDSVRAFPDWSEAVDARVRGGSFDTRVDVPDGVALGVHSVPAACLGTAQGIVVKASVEVIPARLGPTTGEPTNTEPTDDRTNSSSQADDRDRDTGAGDMLGLGGFLVALGAAALVVRSRRKRPEAPRTVDPPLPRVHVRVVADGPPSIHVRQVARTPDVRVRLRACEPWLTVKEVLR
ncbi:hypothetical protein IU427_19590 [Nocardia beijingensis]|uniref:hypothetical protein n=1 Tax=Nocardia beijingensis TaxID=95162 RepID=UPI001892DB27|nr:hypothetical protein [Nocardia beijingensis]MBF6467369.1 hypothetical protein [Nocardia beijingensis]